MVRNKGYKTHIGLVTHQSNYCSIVLWNSSLHQLPKTTEIVTGWESSIAVLTKIIGQPIFWPKNLKFWLQNLQILTLFWLINLLRLELQNNSAFGVDVNSEAKSVGMLQTFKEFVYLTLAMIYLVSTLKKQMNSVCFKLLKNLVI